MPIAPKRLTKKQLIDGFEDGNYTANPSWTLVQNGDYSSPTVEVNTSAAKNGTYGLQIQYTNGSNVWGANFTLTTDCLHPSESLTYSTWIYISNRTENTIRIRYRDTANDLDVLMIGMHGYGSGDPGRFIIGYDGTGEWPDSYRLPSTGWYRFDIDFDPVAKSATFKVYDSSLTLLKSVTRTAGNYTIDKCQIYFSIGAAGATRYVYVDDVTYVGLAPSALTAKR